MLITHKQKFTDTIIANNSSSYQYVVYREGNPTTPTINAVSVYSKDPAAGTANHRVVRKYERTYVEPSDIEIALNLDKGISSVASMSYVVFDNDPIRYRNGLLINISPITLNNLSSYKDNASLGNVTLRNIKTGELYGVINFVKKNILGKIVGMPASKVGHFYQYGTASGNTNVTMTYKWVKKENVANNINLSSKLIFSNVANKHIADSSNNSTTTVLNNSGITINDRKTFALSAGSKISYGEMYLSDNRQTIRNTISDVSLVTVHTQSTTAFGYKVLNLSTNKVTGNFTTNSLLPNTNPALSNSVLLVDTGINLFATDYNITIYPATNKISGNSCIQIHNNSSTLAGTILNNGDTIGNIKDIYNGAAAISSKRELETYVNVFPIIDSYGKFKLITLANRNGMYNANNTIKLLCSATNLNKDFTINYQISEETTTDIRDIIYAHVKPNTPIKLNIGDTVYVPVFHSALYYDVDFVTTDGCELEFTKDPNPIQGYKKYRVDGSNDTIYNYNDNVDGGLYITGDASGTATITLTTNSRAFTPTSTTFNVEVLPNPESSNVELETEYVILTAGNSKRVAYYADSCKDVEVEFIYDSKSYTINSTTFKYYNHETQEMSGYVTIEPVVYDESATFKYPVEFKVVVKALSDGNIIGTNSFRGKVYPTGQHAIEFKDADDLDKDLDTIVNNLNINGTNTYTIRTYTTGKYIMAHEYPNTVAGYQLEEVGGTFNVTGNTEVDVSALTAEFNALSSTGLQLFYPNSKIGYRNDYELYGMYRDHIDKLYSNAAQFEIAKKEAQEHIYRYDAKLFWLYPNAKIGNGYVRFGAYSAWSDKGDEGIVRYQTNGLLHRDLKLNNIKDTTIPADEVWVTLQHRDTTKAINYSGTDTNFTIFKWKNRDSIDDLYGHKIYLPSVSGKLLTSRSNISKQTNKQYFTKSDTVSPSITSNMEIGDSWLDTSSSGKVWVCRDNLTDYNYWYSYPDYIIGNVSLHRYPKVGIGCIPLDVLSTLPITPMDGCYDINSKSYGNYKDTNGNILVYIPAIYVDNANNLSSYKRQGYSLHPFFVNNNALESDYLGILVPKYPLPVPASGSNYSKEGGVKADGVVDITSNINNASGLSMVYLNDGVDLTNLITLIKGNTTKVTNEYSNAISNINTHTDSGIVYDNIRYHMYVKDPIYRKIIEVANEYISVTNGNSVNVTITNNSSEDYTIVNNYKDIVTATTSADGISITGNKVGKAILHIVGTHNGKKCITTLYIKVN